VRYRYNRAMDYHIDIEEGIETPYVGVSLECSPQDFEAQVEQALTQVWALMDEADINPAGPPICLVPQISTIDDEVPPPSPWRLIAGFPVEDEVAGEDPVVVGTLPGGKILTTVHEGELKSLSTAYLALQVYMQSHDLSPNGPPWEVYLTDPVWEPDPEEWRTIVRWAVQ
jgi:effector-binding domain-containing protein